MVDNVFPYGSEHIISADFKQLEEVEEPAFYIHVVQKAG